jgi:hypothetical protein
MLLVQIKHICIQIWMGLWILCLKADYAVIPDAYNAMRLYLNWVSMSVHQRLTSKAGGFLFRGRGDWGVLEVTAHAIYYKSSWWLWERPTDCIVLSLSKFYSSGDPLFLGDSPRPAFSGRSMSQFPTNELYPAPTDFGVWIPVRNYGVYNLTRSRGAHV